MDWLLFVGKGIGVLAASYLIGSIPFGFIIGKLHGIDIREHGSGNIGATNVTRVIGPWTGKLCFFLDFVKGIVPVLLTILLIGKYGLIEDPCGMLPACSSFAVVAGHIWPVYLKFKGGKGVSTAAGAILPLSPYAVLIAFAVWVIVFESSKYVSLASIAAAAVLPLAALALKLLGLSASSWPSVALFFLLGGLAILKHRSNIERLLNGTENRFSGDKK